MRQAPTQAEETTWSKESYNKDQTATLSATHKYKFEKIYEVSMSTIPNYSEQTSFNSE